jgi:hypothetical protein
VGDGGGDAAGDSDAESTRVRPSQRAAPGVSDSALASRPEAPRRSGLLIAVTVVAALVFLVGLGLLLFGPLPEPQAAVESTIDASVPPPLPPAPDASVPADPQPPTGMLLVRYPDGRARAFVDARPVSWEQIAEMFKKPRKPSWAEKNDPATSVSWSQAQSFARSRGRRLVRTAEWEAAAHTEGFVVPDKTLWEWIDDGGGETRPMRSVHSINPAKPLAERAPKGHVDVAFRLAKDL